MSSNYIYSPGGKLGQISSPYGPSGPLNPGSYMSTQAPSIAPILQASGYKPIGTAITEGLQTGQKLGQSFAETPSDIQQKKAQALQSGAEAMLTEAQAKQIQAQTAYQLKLQQGAYANQTSDQPPPTPEYPISNKINQLFGTGGKSGSESTTSGGSSNTNQGTTTNQVNTQVTPQQNQTTTNQATPSGTVGSPGNYSNAPTQNTPQATPANVLSATAAENANYLAEHPEQANDQNALLNSPVAVPKPDPAWLSQNPNVASDGRVYVKTLGNGRQLFFDPSNGQNYTYDPMPGGNERRFYSGWHGQDAFQNGMVVENPWAKHDLQQQDALTKDGHYSPDAVANMSPEQRVAALQTINEMNAEKDLGSGEHQDLANRVTMLKSGYNVLNALKQLKPEDYNAWNQALAGVGNKYATAPIVGDVIKKALGNNPISPELSNLQSQYDAFLSQARLGSDAGKRLNTDEMSALERAIGSPSEHNWDFGRRFSNYMNLQGTNYVDYVDGLQNSRFRLMPRDPSTGMLLPNVQGEDPHNPQHGFQESPWLQYSDAIRKVLPKSIGQPVALTPDELAGKGPGQQSQPQAQAGGQIPVIGSKTNIDEIKGSPMVKVNIGGQSTAIQLNDKTRAMIKQLQSQNQ